MPMHGVPFPYEWSKDEYSKLSPLMKYISEHTFSRHLKGFNNEPDWSIDELIEIGRYTGRHFMEIPNGHLYGSGRTRSGRIYNPNRGSWFN